MAPLVVSPTGSGKTVMFAFIANNAMQNGKRCLILVHRREILQQTMKALMTFGIQAGTIAAGTPMTTDLIQVAMVSTLAHRVDQIVTPDIIITDEAHHSVAGQWMKVQKRFPDAFRIGFTATPERLSGEGLILCFDTMIEGPTTQWLVDNKFLSRPRVFVGPDVQKEEKIKIRMGDYDKKDQLKKRKKRSYVGNVIDHYKKHLDGLPVVCFCVSIEHCEIMKDEFRRFGYRAETVHGGMKKHERDAAIGGLGTGEIQVVCSCDVISEGVDVPVIAGVILLRRTKSLGLYLQQVGRSLRLYPGKEYAIILDHAGNVHEHGLPLDEREWSLFSKKRKDRDTIKLPNQTICISCGGVFPGKVAVCPDCGCNIEEEIEKKNKDRNPEEIEGELVEVGETGKTEQEVKELTEESERIRALDPVERQKEMLASLRRNGNNDKSKELARAVGYKDGWTNYIYNKKIVRR